jgi:hypothetical protein
MKKYVAWWSAGVTSAVATKLALDAYGKENVDIIYFKIDSAHPDNDRFLRECEQWYGKDIEIHQSMKYKDQFDVIAKTGWINGPMGARCTLELKKEVRYKIERERDYHGQIFGFEFSKREINRALRFMEQYGVNPIFPLIEKMMDKPACLHFLKMQGIAAPKMYELGFSNNNCIGCVKGGAGYWNLIRREFPDYFNRMADLEDKVGATCLKDKNGKIRLKDLDPNRGHNQKIIMPDCGNFCDIEFTDIDHKDLKVVLDQGKIIESYYKS